MISDQESPKKLKFTAEDLVIMKQEEAEAEQRRRDGPENDQVPSMNQLYSSKGTSALERQVAFERNLTKLDKTVIDDIREFNEAVERKILMRKPKKKCKKSSMSEDGLPAPARPRTFFETLHRVGFP